MTGASVSAVSNVGGVRDTNQDVIVVGPLSSAGTMANPLDLTLGGQGLVAVVDGMGGHAGGGVAAGIVARGIAAVGGYGLRPEHLAIVVSQANAELYRRAAAEPELTGMGATMAGISWSGAEAVVFHVGDSRVYGRFGSTVERLTMDHRRSEGDNVLTRSLGGTPDCRPVELDFSRLALDRPTRFLCCTDGLSDVVPFDAIERCMVDGTPSGCAGALLQWALDGGAPDNVSLVVVDLPGPTSSAPEQQPVATRPAPADPARGRWRGSRR